MGDEHPNATAYRRTADAFRSRDHTALASLIAAEVTWHVPGSHPMAGEIRGRDTLLAWLSKLWARGFWLAEHVVALSTMGARRDGVDVQTRVVSVFHYLDGQQLERWFYPEDPTAWDEIFTE